MMMRQPIAVILVGATVAFGADDCADYPYAWEDADGDGCSTYAARDWCGASWQSGYKDHTGKTADQACCQCGGGKGVCTVNNGHPKLAGTKILHGAKWCGGSGKRKTCQDGEHITGGRCDKNEGAIYIGCFKDDSSRDLKTGHGYGFNTDSCGEKAKTNGHAFFGLQHNGQCWTGKAFGTAATYTQVSDSECGANLKGSSWRNAVFQTPDAQIVTQESEPAPKLTGEEACEGHGYSETECLAVGCCHFDTDENLGCMSDVGDAVCEDFCGDCQAGHFCTLESPARCEICPATPSQCDNLDIGYHGKEECRALCGGGGGSETECGGPCQHGRFCTLGESPARCEYCPTLPSHCSFWESAAEEECRGTCAEAAGWGRRLSSDSDLKASTEPEAPKELVAPPAGPTVV